jgi:ABC-type amino acid transport substrate-binding protein
MKFKWGRLISTTISLFALCLVAEIVCIQIQAKEHLDRNEESLKVGTVDDFLPCSDYINQTYEGMAIDIWRRVGQRLKLEYEVSSIASFDEAVNLAAIGEFDVIASCHEITPERLELIEYAVPYTSGGIVIVSKQNQRPVIQLIVKILQNKIVVRCSLLLLLVTAITAFTSKYFRNSKDTRKSKTRRFTRAWTFLILNDGIDTIIGPKIIDNIAVLISSLSHMLLMSAVIGTTAAIIFEENIARKTNELDNKELKSLLYEGIAVIGESSTASWLDSRIKMGGLASELSLKPITVNTKSEMIDVLRGNSAKKARHFVSNITTYLTVLKDAGLEEEFAISYQSPRKTPQSFLFGSKLNDDLKQLINIEIAKMNRSGLTEQLEEDWRN